MMFVRCMNNLAPKVGIVNAQFIDLHNQGVDGGRTGSGAYLSVSSYSFRTRNILTLSIQAMNSEVQQSVSDDLI